MEDADDDGEVMAEQQDLWDDDTSGKTVAEHDWLTEVKRCHQAD